ncbi:hypothetical protein PAXINDRAFT_157922 [Paxillus involutus ATCC 200175]|uniref:C2H2-type domain-containing protein n=1 Tax=Paxillus involutus ATCC 200175 TaxID=664439 RepID=A0A0C9TQ60_PAXIN|nr:hypothetical protein PAXINDRAFT_157922 [Paxillus involutus ATCC 200175]
MYGKGMTVTPWRNPEHALHGGPGLHPLLCNPMLTRVAILLAKGVFGDFKTVDELLKVEAPKPEEGIVRIEWHPDFLNQPVYERDDGHIWSVRIRAGFPPITNHDFRAEGIDAIGELLFVVVHGFSLVNLHVDRFYSSSPRRRHARHGSDDVYEQYYAPRNPGTDGQGAYAGNTPRTLLPKLLRILKMNHNPELAQSLPARELHELVTSDEYSAITDELESLSDPTTLLLGRNGLISWPLLFTVASICSEAGRAVLEDLITLYRSEFEVEHRPGLEPERFHCPRHLDQDDQDSWRSHCESHLTSLDILPYQCDPLTYSKTLAAPGLCFRCLGDMSLPPASQMQQFLSRAQWQTHIEKHLAESNGCKLPTCPHPRCTEAFKSSEELDFHLQDVHCWIPRDSTKLRAAVKRSRSEEDEEKPLPSTSPSSTSATSPMDICTPELSDASSSTSPTSSTFDTPFHELTSNAHNKEDSTLDPEFAAALEQFDLGPEKGTQSDDRGFPEAERHLSLRRSRYRGIPFVGFQADSSRDDALGHPGGHYLWRHEGSCLALAVTSRHGRVREDPGKSRWAASVVISSRRMDPEDAANEKRMCVDGTRMKAAAPSNEHAIDVYEDPWDGR